MSKIDDALQEINQYLAGNDHSDNPAIRKAAVVYAQACRDINNKLSECRQLIARGLLVDAQKIDMEMQPTLSERAEKLILSGDFQAQYQELCLFYDYEKAPAIDQDALDQLRQNPSGKAQILKELILRWRKIARTSTNLEKIKLLRSIIACSPEDDKIWRTNLASVERQWINDLCKESERAIAEKDGNKIVQIYMALSDPELQTTIPETVLQQIRPYVRKHQQVLLNNDLEKKRTELFNAYSALNIDLVAERLREYDQMTTNPLYEKDIAAEQAVDEVRVFLKQQLDARRAEEFHATKLAELLAELDKHGSYEVIENLYETLRKTDIPLDRLISIRVANRREEYFAENSRRHLRKCICGIVGALSLVLVAFLIIHAVQSTRNYLSNHQAMKNLLNNENYEGVIKLHDQIQEKSPILLKFGKLTELKMEAERLQAAMNEQEKKLGDLLQKAEEELALQKPSLDELKLLMDAIKQEANFTLSAEFSARKQKIEFAVRQLKYKTQQELDRNFTAQYQDFMKKLDRYAQDMLNSKNSSSTIESGINNVLDAMEKLTQKSQAVSKDLRESQNSMLQSRGKSLLQNLKNLTDRRSLTADLYTPKSFENYCDTLKKLPSEAPDLASGDWRKIISNIGIYQSLDAGARLGSCITHDDLNKAIAAQTVSLAGNCFVNDMLRLLPDKNFTFNRTQQLGQLKNDLSQSYNYYELSFIDENNIRWYFYSDRKPEVDKSRNSRIPKALAIQVMLTPGKPGKYLAIRINKTSDGKLTYQTTPFQHAALPDKFVELSNVLLSSNIFPKAAHSIALENILHELLQIDEPLFFEGKLLELLNKLKQADSINIFARAELCKRLLDMLPLCSLFYNQAVGNINTPLVANQHLFNRWYLPTVEAEFSSNAADLRKFFQAFDSESLRKNNELHKKLHKLALERSIVPAGIIVKQDSKISKIHYFVGKENITELWFYTPGAANGQSGWVAMEKQSVINGLKSSPDAIPNGTVFFTPFDGKSTESVAKEIIDEFQANKIDRSDIFWPDSWPLNYR